jgi:indolepyruvate ferredoxin oxidoreductase beta subunit
MAMGGEGGGVLADWIVDVAERVGYYAQTTSVPGVAQRTGATIYYLEIFPEESVKASGREPVLALMPVPGEVDVVIASELMEAGRAVQRGLVTPDRTTLIASTHRVYSMTERTAIGDGRVDANTLVDASAAAAKTFVRGDFAHMAEESGSVISASLFGALAATRALPFSREQFEDAIRRGGVGVEASLAAFAAGHAAAEQPASTSAAAPAPAPDTAPSSARSAQVGPRVAALVARLERSFPATSHDILLAGVTRCADFQDERYAAQYLDRLDGIRDVDASHGPGTYALLRETGRYLALWMTYEDAIRVADLKIRRTRFERVHQEVHARDTQVLQINEFLHPRVEELTDIMPTALGRWLLGTRWARSLVERLTRHGKIVTTTSLSGFFQLYAIASLRPWRRRSLRFQGEQRSIAAWLTQVLALAPEDYELALSVAECPRLLKGYGDTHHRGVKNFDIVMGAIPTLRRHPDPAASIRRLRDAALADDTGERLAATMRELG